ncbi:MAG: hypothetical protein H7Y18_20670, partial [Clostridiaceae bacterium]|nr:hypothetical protein [Clostridiaceae bacterium]
MYNSRILKNNCVSFSEPVCIDNYITLFEVIPTLEAEEIIDEDEAVLIKNKIIKVANDTAEQILIEANQEAERIKQNAKREMEIIRIEIINEA